MSIGALIVCHRFPETLELLIERALKWLDDGAIDTLLITVDPKTTGEAKVPEYLATLTGRKEVLLVVRSTNLGLQKNMLDSISLIASFTDYFYVFEEDLIFHYESPLPTQLAQPVKIFSSGVAHLNCFSLWRNDIGVWHEWRGMHCWGWATTSRYWNKFIDSELNPLGPNFSIDYKNIPNIDLNGIFTNSIQVEENRIGKRNTWAVFWQIFLLRQDLKCISVPWCFTKPGFSQGCNSSPLSIVFQTPHNIRPVSNAEAFNRRLVSTEMLSVRLTYWRVILFGILIRIKARLKCSP